MNLDINGALRGVQAINIFFENSTISSRKWSKIFYLLSLDTSMIEVEIDHTEIISEIRAHGIFYCQKKIDFSKHLLKTLFYYQFCNNVYVLFEFL